MIENTYKGVTYTHPGWASPRAFHQFVKRHAATLDAPLVRLVPRMMAAYRTLANDEGDAFAAGMGAAMANAAEVADLLAGRPSSAIAEAVTTDEMYLLVGEILQGVTVDGMPCGGVDAWHRKHDPWGPHWVALAIVWEAQGFPMPGGSLSGTGAEE